MQKQQLGKRKKQTASKSSWSSLTFELRAGIEDNQNLTNLFGMNQ
jgi:hypothetical protein